MRLIILSLFCLMTYSCSQDTETTYSKSTQITTQGSASDIESGESLEDWTLRIITMLDEENIDVITFWIDDSKKKPSMCGCWSCMISGYILKVTTTAGSERMIELGFE